MKGLPDVPTPTDPRWSGVTLPWMSIGYGLKLTPLQTLTFYNAVANDGVMVQPLLVKSIKTGEPNGGNVPAPKCCAIRSAYRLPWRK